MGLEVIRLPAITDLVKGETNAIKLDRYIIRPSKFQSQVLVKLEHVPTKVDR